VDEQTKGGFVTGFAKVKVVIGDDENDSSHVEFEGEGREAWLTETLVTILDRVFRSNEEEESDDK